VNDLSAGDAGGHINRPVDLVQRGSLFARLVRPVFVVMLRILGAGVSPAAARIRRIVPRANAVPEPEELTLDTAVPHRGFCLAGRRTSSRISSGTGGRPVAFE
jgi:hypothetical protein